MVDFGKLAERARQARIERRRQTLQRFGLEEPLMDIICSRCGERYGNHYTAGKLYCPDEWLAEGHQLSPV